VVARPAVKPEPNDEEKARRIKLEKELEAVKVAQAKSKEGIAKLEQDLKEAQSALARKMAEPPPPPAPKLAFKAPKPASVRIYRPLLDTKKDPVEEISIDGTGRTMVQREQADDNPEPRGFGFGSPSVAGTDAETRGETHRTP
jgi:hypothetical protein